MFALISLAADRASAQLSPGELSRAHAEIDTSRDCLECHAKGQGVTRELCLSCHTLLGERIEAKAGLHARPDYQQCETCHIEHHGRDFELIWWGKAGIEAFDHGETGYPLVGAHLIECRQCHQASLIPKPAKLVAAGKDLDRTFLGLAADCASCHQDPHRDQMAPRGCNACHGEEAWQPAPGFDHDLTDFPLDGQHLQAECADCHPTETDDDGSWILYQGISTTCADCHEDPHRGRLGRDCAACHTTVDWQEVDRSDFNHDLTRFPLRGLHNRVDCAGCHQGDSFRVAGFASLAPGSSAGLCITCHADVHVGQFRERASLTASGTVSDTVSGGGGACSDCHDVNGFTPSLFDLADHAETRFPLEGAHRELACASCHEQVATSELVARGIAVATPDAPATAQIFTIEATACTDCHRDPHAGSADAFLGEVGCENCHTTDDWHNVSQTPTPGVTVGFDHDATGFALEGVHRTVGCVECHAVSVRGTDEVVLSFEGAPTACRDCHEDPHLGQFDQSKTLADCRTCHSPEGWAPAIFDHNRDSVFPLEGAHARAACAACHLPETIEGREIVRYKPLPTACSGCHLAPTDSQASRQ